MPIRLQPTECANVPDYRDAALEGVIERSGLFAVADIDGGRQ